MKLARVGGDFIVCMTLMQTVCVNVGVGVGVGLGWGEDQFSSSFLIILN